MHAVDAYLRRHSGDRSLPVLLETLLRYVKHVVATKQAAAYADLLSAAFDIFDVVLGAPGATATMRHRLAYQLISDRTIECLLVWDSQSGPSVPLLVIQAVLKVVPSVFAHLGERLTGLLHAFSESTVDTLLDRLIALLRLATPAVVVADAEGATTAVLAASTLNQLVLQVPRFPIYLLRLELPGATLPANAEETLALSHEEAVMLLNEYEFDEQLEETVYLNWPEDIWDVMRQAREKNPQILDRTQTLEAIDGVSPARAKDVKVPRPAADGSVAKVKAQPALLYALLFLTRYLVSDLVRLHLTGPDEPPDTEGVQSLAPKVFQDVIAALDLADAPRVRFDVLVADIEESVGAVADAFGAETEYEDDTGAEGESGEEGGPGPSP